ncbi:lytic transglycosylase domain-containing protein [Marivivens marinus]|uniref:lytic transglycosylase domain-containing protein n=1 Tax=Marivivens marinus TaxID=3110173 RepID=UPI003B8453DA
MKRRFATAITLAAGLACQTALAEGDRLQPDFTFKRVTVPQPGQQQLINVQVTPRPDVPAAAVSAPAPGTDAVAGAVPGLSGSDWFWAAISPALEDSAPGRLTLATITLSNPPEGKGVTPPRLQSLHEIAKAHGTDILRTTVGTRVSPALVLSVIAVESAGDSDARSRAGAQGLMQLMPDTATRFGVTDPYDPAQNIAGGVAYLDWLMGEFDDDPILVLAAYNAGEGNIRDHSGVPPFPETRNYVPKVLSAWGVARGLCMTPPELVSDGCVFTLPAASGG